AAASSRCARSPTVTVGCERAAASCDPSHPRPRRWCVPAAADEDGPLTFPQRQRDQRREHGPRRERGAAPVRHARLAAVDVDQRGASASSFENKVYPTDRRLYGSEWSPGVDSDPHINILLAKIPGAAAGYFSSSDELPLWVNEFSAEREMVYINSLAARP